MSPEPSPALGAKHKTSISGNEPRLEQMRPETRDGDVLAIDLADDDLALSAVLDDGGK